MTDIHYHYLRVEQERLDELQHRHGALIEALSRLLGYYSSDGAVPLDKLQAVIDRDLARGREGGGQ